MSMTGYSTASQQLIEIAQPHQQTKSIAGQSHDPVFRIAVFAPFNHGKSTLLNALLGVRALPTSLQPTTGTAVVIKSGENLRTCVQTHDGQERCEDGTQLVQRFAVLENDQALGDAASVELFSCHPLLAQNVELIDLPGTDHTSAQDALVQQWLLTAHLVIQVLDARKLFTLGEVNRLQNWLIRRGMQSTIFVLNFMNLLEIQEQKEVIQRTRSIIEEFPTMELSNINSLYRVDALPALRSKLRGDQAGMHTSGILLFESILHQLITQRRK